MTDSLKKIFVFLILGSLTLSAFFVRLHNFKASDLKSIDEIVYFYLGTQLAKEVPQYNTIGYAHQLTAQGRDLPEYFFEPLFKHPPFFSFMIALCLKIFNPSLVSAGYVAIFFGALIILATYFLAREIYGWKAGLLSAFFVYWDPMTMMCSQKVWMESVIAFFTVLSVFFFVKGLKSDKGCYFLLSGCASALAALNKYSGALSTLIFIVYATVYARHLFKNKYFVVSLFLPLLFLIPWFIWNINVYGFDFLFMQQKLHSNPQHFNQLIHKGLLFLALGVLSSCLFIKLKKDIASEVVDKKTFRLIVWSLGGGIGLWIFYPSLLKSFQLLHIPLTSWAGATFYGSAITFYVDRLFEFSLIYVIKMTLFYLEVFMMNKILLFPLWKKESTYQRLFFPAMFLVLHFMN